MTEGTNEIIIAGVFQASLEITRIMDRRTFEEHSSSMNLFVLHSPSYSFTLSLCRSLTFKNEFSYPSVTQDKECVFKFLTYFYLYSF